MNRPQLVDDKPAIIRYDGTKKSLVYSYGENPEVEIQAGNIIAATTEQLLFVDSSSDESPQKSPLVKSLKVQGLPEPFLKQFCRSPHVDEGRQIHVVVSVASGARLAQHYYDYSLSGLLDQLNSNQRPSHQVHYTQSEDTITELTKTTFMPLADEGQKLWIILLSGDGGVVDVVNAMLSRGGFSENYSKPRLSVLPLGTGNALANSLKTMGDNTMGLAAMTRGQLGSLPLFRATFSPRARLLSNEARQENELHHSLSTGTSTFWGAVVCSWGMHASLVADSDTAEYRQHGAARFQLAAKAALFPDDGSPPHPYSGRVSVLRKIPGDAGVPTWDALDREQHAYVLATFVSNLEQKFMISPASTPLDAKLRLLHFGPMPGDEVMKIMMAAYDDGKHVQDPRVSYEEIEGLRIHFDEDDPNWRRVCIDGKIIRVEKGGYIEVTKETTDVLDIFHM
ncbi:hypothetical protein MBLNU459_g7594t1 [Dothideomycetes sp. NU459]